MIQKETDLSGRRQCKLLGITRFKVYYEPKEPKQETAERKEAILSRINYWHTPLFIAAKIE